MTFLEYALAVFVLILAFLIMMCFAARGYEIAHEPTAAAEPHVITGQHYILCGKGYEDPQAVSQRFVPMPGRLYVNRNGECYKCLRTTADSCAVLMDINSGTLLTVRSVRAYQDGKIDYQIVECVRLAGAAV